MTRNDSKLPHMCYLR